MKKILFTIAALAAAATAAHAATSWNLRGVEYRVDTLEHYKAAPGTTITVLDLLSADKAVRQRVWVSETDLTNENVDITTYNPPFIRTTNTTLTNMVKNRAGDGNIYCVGVNADLFSTNGPIGTTVMEGEVIKTAKASTAWHAVGYQEHEGLYFGTADLKFNAKLNGKMEYAPSLVNVPLAEGETIIYTPRWGKTTGTKQGECGLEIVLRPEGGILRSDGETVCTVVGAPKTDGFNTAIPAGCLVLSTNISSHVRDLGKMKDGDKYTINMASASIKSTGFGSHMFTDLRTMIGGDPVLLVDGKTLPSYATMPNYNARRPRTAIGTDATRKIMKLLVVDGDKFNAGISDGVDANDLAAMMLAIGCSDALNFDGGGSSEMWENIFGVLNRPSDGHSRAVRNAWFITTPDKGDNAMSAIEFACGPQTLEVGDTFTPKFYGYNSVGVLVEKDITGVKLIAPAGLGTVSADGKTLTVTGDGTYRLEARKGDFVCYLGVRAGDYMANQSGVADVVVSDTDAPVEYYTLQGVRVLNPAGGVFIRRQGSAVAKIIL